MDFFFRDSNNNIHVGWEQLIVELNDISSYNPFCYVADFYSVFKNIIISLVIDKEIILLDNDFTSDELKKLTGFSEFSSFARELDIKINITTKKELLDRINSLKSNWTITLFTSGTTGIPKKVKHSFASITRFVKQGKNRQNDVWGFAYNPTHMAGIQVFFQAILNGNNIIRLFGQSPENVFNNIQQNNITHISATPTFYRLLLPEQGVYESVLRITSGGEKFDVKTLEQLRFVFPNAKYTNVYASTEAGTLFAGEGDAFLIRDEIKEFIKIVKGELLIHKSLMGTMNSDDGDWYQTGDMVEQLSEAPLKFRFLIRKNEMINVGGYKVNPNEVEDVLRQMIGIKEVRIYAKSNAILGNIICGEVVCNNADIDEQTIRQFLQIRLQEFKIPRIIRFVDSISTTRTGKIKRN